MKRHFRKWIKKKSPNDPEYLDHHPNHVNKWKFIDHTRTSGATSTTPEQVELHRHTLFQCRGSKRGFDQQLVKKDMILYQC